MGTSKRGVRPIVATTAERTLSTIVKIIVARAGARPFDALTGRTVPRGRIRIAGHAGQQARFEHEPGIGLALSSSSPSSAILVRILAGGADGWPPPCEQAAELQ